MIEIASLVVAIISALIAWKTFKRTPKPTEPPAQLGIVAFDVVKMPELPGLPGYDVKRRKGPLGR